MWRVRRINRTTPHVISKCQDVNNRSNMDIFNSLHVFRQFFSHGHHILDSSRGKKTDVIIIVPSITFTQHKKVSPPHPLHSCITLLKLIQNNKKRQQSFLDCIMLISKRIYNVVALQQCIG